MGKQILASFDIVSHQFRLNICLGISMGP